MFVVVIVPVLLVVPTVRVFIPPAVTMLPAVMPRLCQFRTPVLRLGAIGAMFVNCLMQIVVCLFRSLLAVVIRAQGGSTNE